VFGNYGLKKKSVPVIFEPPCTYTNYSSMTIKVSQVVIWYSWFNLTPTFQQFLATIRKLSSIQQIC